MIEASIGGIDIGEGKPLFVVAELGICHEGRLDLALELVEAAAEARCDCVKTEAFQRSTLVAEDTEVDLVIAGRKVTMPLSQHMAEFELTLNEHLQIKEHCDRKNLPFMSTAHDAGTVDFLKDIGAAAVKIASPDIVHYPLLRHAGRSGLPVVMDTGASTFSEIARAVEELRRCGARDIVVNYNPEGHPAPIEGHRLGALDQFKLGLNVPAGLSDHFAGYEMAFAAAARGANLIEKPVSMDRFAPGPEKAWSVSAADLKGFVETVKAVGSCLKGMPPMFSEAQNLYRARNRCSLVAGQDLGAGEILGLEKVVFARPSKGIGVENWDLVAGRRLRAAKKRGEFIFWNDME